MFKQNTRKTCPVVSCILVVMSPMCEEEKQRSKVIKDLYHFEANLQVQLDYSVYVP